jgi:branched-chain amino acid transport system substrate-binding protein
MKLALKRTLMALVSVAGMAWATAVSAQTDVLKIGVVSALTGPGSEWGTAQEGGARIAAMEVNANGGLKVGGKSYKVEVIAYDDQYKLAAAVTGATRLIEQDKVKYVVGPMGSAGVLAVEPLYEKNKVLAIIGSWSDKALTKDTKYVFRGFPTLIELGRPMVQWVRKNRPELKTIADINPNDESGWSAQRILKERYLEAGFKIVASELVERNTKDFQPVMTKILASNPDVIDLSSMPPGGAGLIMRQSRELGYKGPFLKIGGPGTQQIVAAAGKEYAEGLIVYAAADPDAPAYKNLEAQYAKVMKPPMNSFTVYFYDSVHQLFDAMQAAGTVEDTDKVVAAMEKLTPYKGIQGEIRWTGQKEYGANRQIATPIFVGVIKDGEEKIVGRVE